MSAMHLRDHNLLRQMNIALVARLLRELQPVSRIRLAERAGLGRSTITGIIQQMIGEGLVREVGEEESTGGRKPVLLELVSGCALVACVRLTPRTATLGLADLNGRLVARHRRALRGEREPEEVLERVTTWVTEMLRESRPESTRVVATGLVVPGRVEPDLGHVTESAAFGWTDAPVGQRLAGRIGMEVLVESEGSAFVLGEWNHGAGSGADHLLGLSLGAGVGSGLVLDGRLCRGMTGGVGEVAHLQVDPEGPVCECGRRGCLTALVSDRALVGQALAALDRGAASLIPELVEGVLPAVTREVIVAAAQDGDRLGARLLEQAGHRVGTALAQVANVVGPSVIIMGGDAVDQAGDLILGPATEALLSRLVPWLKERVQVRAAALGEAGLLLGAAERVLERVFRIPGPLDPPDSDPLSIANWLPEET